MEDQYYVVATTDTSISVSDTLGGTAITLDGDGGMMVLTPGAAEHIKLAYDPFGAVCNIQQWDLSIERESRTSRLFPVVLAALMRKSMRPSRRTQTGYASGSGTYDGAFHLTATLALGQRMLDNVMLHTQDGARVRLFVKTVSDGAATPAPDLTSSMYIEADINLESMSVSVNPDDPLSAEISF